MRYDLAGVKNALSKEALAQRPPDIWRYRELLPVRKVTDIVSLGETRHGEPVDPRMAEREEAREAKEFERADEIRERLAELGWEVRDAADGARLVPRS